MRTNCYLPAFKILTLPLDKRPRFKKTAIIWRSDDVFTLWPWPLTFSLEQLQHIGCHVIELCTKFGRNRTIRGWVIDRSANLWKIRGGIGKISELRFQDQPRTQPLIYFWGGELQGSEIQHIFTANFSAGNFVPLNFQSWGAT